MMEIEKKYLKRGSEIKIYGRIEGQPPVTATVRDEDLHLYSHADMSHEDWTLFCASGHAAINETKRRLHPEKLVVTSALSGGVFPKAKRR